MPKLRFSDRVWLAWKVMRSQLVSVSWDMQSGQVDMSFVGTKELRERFMVRR